MKTRYYTLALSFLLFTALSACSSKPQQQLREQVPVTDQEEIVADPIAPVPLDSAAIPRTIHSGDRVLSLVRMMDGGVCKNDTQGVSGVFLVYADSNDISRVIEKQGKDVFSSFDVEIENIALAALTQAVNSNDLSIDPFALDVENAHQRIAGKLSKAFIQAVTSKTNLFQQASGLYIEIYPFDPGYVFFLEGCDLNQHPPLTE